MTHWEYTLVPFFDQDHQTDDAAEAALLDALNAHGAVGWELVAILENYLVFKRSLEVDA